MSIEFRCTQCNRLLRTGDDTVGKQAQCPECQAITTIPARSTAPDGPAMQSPFPSSELPPNVVQPEMPSEPASRPYSSAGPYYASAGPYNNEVLMQEAARVRAAARVMIPATALLVFAVFGLVSQFLFFYKLGVHGLDAVVPPEFRKNPDFAALPKDYLLTALVIVGVIGLAVSVLMLFGGLSMKNLQSYPFAMMAAIIGLIPCMSPCCPFPMPFAIWALIVLYDPAVRAAFKH